MKTWGKKGLRLRGWRVLCGILAGSLLLAGCGRMEPVYETQKNGSEGQEKREDSDRADTEDTAAISEETREEARSRVEEKIKLLALLKRDDNFGRCVRESAELEYEDTAEIIKQKLEQCEDLSLSDFWDPFYSLEELSLLPNLKSLSVRINRDDSMIRDFSPVTELSRLEKFSVEYAEKEIDLSFLAGMETVTGLALSNCRIEDLTFLECMPQLKCLSLCETSIDDFAFLDKLPELTELELVSNAGSEHVEAVGKLYDLRDLALEECGIADISFLSGLTELRSLNLNGNSIADITVVENMSKLERLEAAENEIEDILPLKDLSNLYKLELDGNRIRDISSLSGLSHLSQVELSDNQISDLSPLSEKEELVYVSVAENPYTGLKPVWEVPMLSFANFVSPKITDVEAQTAENWMGEQYPEMSIYECIDYVEGDLNGDGRQDIAFVIDGFFGDAYEEEPNDEMFGCSRRLFVLLGEEDGFLQKLAEFTLTDRYGGGTRGDPYRGIFLGEGYLISKEEWGSGTGAACTNIYFCQQGKLEQVKAIWVDNNNNRRIYDVTVTDLENDTWSYSVVPDGRRMVRFELSDSEHPFHKAFSKIDLDIYFEDEVPDVNTAASSVLDSLKNNMAPGAEKVNLPYAPWQKESLDLLTRVDLPEYYYIVPGTEGTESAEISGEDAEDVWEGDYIYYSGLTRQEGQLCHVVYYMKNEERNSYLISDDTGEIQEE